VEFPSGRPRTISLRFIDVHPVGKIKWTVTASGRARSYVFCPIGLLLPFNLPYRLRMICRGRVALSALFCLFIGVLPRPLASDIVADGRCQMAATMALRRCDDEPVSSLFLSSDFSGWFHFLLLRVILMDGFTILIVVLLIVFVLRGFFLEWCFSCFCSTGLLSVEASSLFPGFRVFSFSIDKS